MAGRGHRLDLVFDTVLPSGERMRYQVLRIAVPRKGRALLLLQLAYYRDDLSPDKSQNQIEQDALLAVIGPFLRAFVPWSWPIGASGAAFLRWLKEHHLDYAVRIEKGSCITEGDGRRWKLGGERLKVGALRFCEGVRYGLYHDRPREIWINVALCWRVPKSRAVDPRGKQPEEPWYVATSLGSARSAASWYWQRDWIEQPFKDAKSRFGLKGVGVGSPQRLSRLLMTLTIALSWLTLMGLPKGCGVVPEGFRSSVSAWGRASVISVALLLLEKLGNLPLCCLPQSPPQE